MNTIANTSLYKEFNNYVVGKFRSMGNFSMIQNGKRGRLVRIENKLDTQETRDYIWGLQRMAQQLKYDESIIYISDTERLAIKEKVSEICKSRGILKAKFFREVKYSIGRYNRIICKRNIYKNETYDELCKILFD